MIDLRQGGQAANRQRKREAEKVDRVVVIAPLIVLNAGKLRRFRAALPIAMPICVNHIFADVFACSAHLFSIFLASVSTQCASLTFE